MKRIVGITGVTMAAVAAMACGGGRGVDRTVTPAPVRAQLARALAVELPQRVELSGAIEAGRQATVSSRVMAAVTAVRVNVGDTVRAGQLLVEIDAETSGGQEAQARGALAQAQAALTVAQRNFERFKALAATGAASELELDLARMQHEQALGAVQQAQGAVTAAGSVARESRVVAPFHGRISARMVEVGDLVAPGRPLVVVESKEGRRLRLSVPESAVMAAGLKIGDHLAIRLDAAPGLGELPGRVVEMSPGANPMTHAYEVKVGVPSQDVATGSAGRAWLVVGSRRAVTVPVAAVLRPGGVTMVVVRDAEGRARSQVVSLGNRLPEDRVEVLSGLAGEEHVLLGLASLPVNGAPVLEVGS